MNINTIHVRLCSTHAGILRAAQQRKNKGNELVYFFPSTVKVNLLFQSYRISRNSDKIIVQLPSSNMDTVKRLVLSRPFSSFIYVRNPQRIKKFPHTLAFSCLKKKKKEVTCQVLNVKRQACMRSSSSTFLYLYVLKKNHTFYRLVLITQLEEKAQFFKHQILQVWISRIRRSILNVAKSSLHPSVLTKFHEVYSEKVSDNCQ